MQPTARIIADSISPTGVRITTFEAEYWRAIHAEFMTHRQLSKNAASSRAIPVEKQIALIKENTAYPVHWGKNQPGMSAKEECEVKFLRHRPRLIETAQGVETHYEKVYISREEAWNEMRDHAIRGANEFREAGYHKQIVNRPLEPFAHIKIVVTATEWDNFFYLRCHADAQPDIQALAWAMRNARDASVLQPLGPGQWHTPYFKDGYWDASMTESLEDALAISASCCAQVSYRKNDDSLEKAQAVYNRLVESKPVHASPFEHQATPIDTDAFDVLDPASWPQGLTHVDRNLDVWSGNFREWIQHRQLIPGHVFKGESNV